MPGMTGLFESGYFYREPAWHKLGNVSDRRPESWDDFRTLAGLDWEPYCSPLYVRVPAAPGAEPTFREESERKAILRSDTHYLLEAVNSTLPLILHGDMGYIADALFEGDKSVQIETGGSLDGGRGVWTLFQLGEGIEVPGDTSRTLPFVAMLNRHDGSGALKFIATSIRIVCQNTWNAADSQAEGNGTVATIRHTTNWRDKVEEARAALRGARKQAEDLGEWFTFLTGIEITEQQVRETVDAMFVPTGGWAAVKSDTVRTNIEAAIGEFWGCYNGPGCAELPSTAYRFAQAAGEYAVYSRPIKQKDKDKYRDAQTGRAILSPDGFKLKAINTLGKQIGEKLTIGSRSGGGKARVSAGAN